MNPIVNLLGKPISDYHTNERSTTVAEVNESMSIDVDIFDTPLAHRVLRLEEEIHSFPLFLDPASFTIPVQDSPPALPGQTNFQQYKLPVLDIPSMPLENATIPTETAAEIHQYSFALPETTQGALQASHVPMDVVVPSQSFTANNPEAVHTIQPRRYLTEA
jgi:hypothetical protein